MNWSGGSRARARVQEQYNRGPRNLRRNSDVLDGDDDSSMTRDNDDSNDNAASQGNPGRHTRAKRPREFHPGLQKQVDYEALGFKLVERAPVQRRVVPLLEFAEKTFPKFGHILSLQLNHQMDITRTLTPQTCTAMGSEARIEIGQEFNSQSTPKSSDAEAQRSTPSSGISVVSSGSTTTSKTTSNTTTTTDTSYSFNVC